MKTLKNYCKNQVLEDTILKKNSLNIYEGPSLIKKINKKILEKS